ncbi:hypothetical protein LWI29_030723 [Acer saccharum]|uniref:C2H2-type domain-containing protein n=1 Tax=Acer saccharum TaxID=4024 RepID=A0AA39RZB3_ACESA|nr:hypothetical protein LWI29_030723 [Acer saccharum]
MYKKKRPSASRHKQQPPPPLSAAADQPSPSQLPTPAAVESVLESEIKQAISRALTEMKFGVREKALAFIKESVSRYPLSGHLHHVEAMIHLRLADHAEDESDQQVEHLEDGILSAKLAVDFLPKSIHSAALLADLHFQLAFVDQEWVRVIELCMQALEMENPDDSGIAELFGEDGTDESVIEEDKDTIMMLLSDSKRKIRELGEKKLAEEANVDVEDDDSEETEDSEEKKDNRVDIERVVVAMDRRKKQFKAITRVCRALKQKMIGISKKLNGDIETIVEYLRFWNVSLSVETKRGFQKVNIKELVKHLKALDCQLVVDHLLEAIDFAKEEQTLQFWECYVCVKKFGDYDSYRQHFWEVHWVDTAWKLASDFDISKKSVDIITNCAWKPVDIAEARKMFDRKSESCSTSNTSADNPKWVFCNDAQRAALLARIRGMFDLLLKNNCLASSHINFVIEYTKDQFEGTIPMSLYRNHHHGLETLQIICCLNVSQLTEFLEFLAGVARNCGLGEDAEIDSSMEYKQSDKFFAVRIDFNKDCSCFLWQELQGEPDDKFDAAVEDDGSAIMLPLERESSVFFDGNDHIVSWLHVGSNCVEILESWTCLIDFQRLQAMKFLKMFDEELLHVSKLCDGHIKISGMLKAVQVIGSLIVEEINKREKSPKDYQPQHLLDLLRTRRQAIQDNIDDISVRTELEVISSILGGSLVILRRDQSGSEARSEEEEWKQADDAIKFVTRRLKMQMLTDMAYLDAIVLRIVVALGQYERELASISVYDYRSIIVPMIKSFLQPRLKDMYEDAKEKSKAAAEALLADLTLEETEKKIDKEDADKKKKKKNKKKNKKKKNKTPKTAEESEESDDDSKHIELQQIGAEQETDDPNAQNEDSVDELKQSSISDDERKLTQYLENQKQFEEEASLNVNAQRSEDTNEDKASLDVNMLRSEVTNEDEASLDVNAPRSEDINEDEASLDVNALRSEDTNEDEASLDVNVPRSEDTNEDEASLDVYVPRSEDTNEDEASLDVNAPMSEDTNEDVDDSKE